MKVFVFFKPYQFDILFNSYLKSSSGEELRVFSEPLSVAYNEIRQWALSIGGSGIFVGNELGIVIPADRIRDLSDFMRKFEPTVKTKFSVGIGMTPFEAFKAMDVSEMHHAERVVIYSPDVETELQSPGEVIKSLDESLPQPELEHQIELPGINLGDKPKDENNAKKKILETLVMLKQRIPELLALKQQSPEAYKAVKQVIDSLVQVAQTGKI